MTLRDLSAKDVIQLKTGENLGRIDDVVFDEHGGRLQSVILRGREHPHHRHRRHHGRCRTAARHAPPLMSANCIFCVKFRKNRLYFLGYYAIIKIQQAESEESAMQTTRKLAVLTVLAAVLIAAGALFLIAPVWQPQRPAAAYVPAAVHTAAPEAPTLIDINTATAEELTALPGLGPRKAAALVAYREAHGPFATLADAAAVKGISLRMTESWAGLAAANH